MGQAIGIDFGTTNTVVSYKNKRGNLKQLDYNGHILIPSVIYFKTKDNYLIGYSARNNLATNPAACVENFKSKLGERGFSYKVKAENGDAITILPRRAVKLFLSKIINDIEQKLFDEFGTDNGVIDRVVITVPAKFNPTEIESIKKAAGDALNLKVRAVFEPTAAAVAAMEEDGEAVNKVLIYDLGGGTFDVSFIQRNSEKNKFKNVVSPDGDKKLGGNLFTELLAEKLLDWANEEYGTEFKMNYFDEDYGISELHYKQNLIAVRREANRVKEELSEVEVTNANFNFWTSEDNSEDADIPVTRKEFEKIIKKKVVETVNKTYEAVTSPQAAAIGEIDKIVLAGGSSKIPLIKDLLSEKLDREVECSDEVSTLISRGAAILAQDMNQLDDIEQVTSFQIGISATEGLNYGKFQMIIPENVSLPYTNTRDFRLAQDNQRGLDIAYYEYDIKKYPKATRTENDGFQEIDVLHIELPEGLKKNNTTVRVTFAAEADGSLNLSAEILDGNGNKIDSGKLHVDKESDLL